VRARILRLALLTLLGLTAAAPAAAQTAGTASISGRITAEDTGLPLADRCAIAWNADTFLQVASGCTDADGNYTVPGLAAGRYHVQFPGDPLGGRYLEQWWPGRREAPNAAVIELADGEQRSGIDAVLRVSTGVTGVVTDAAGAPVEGVCATPYNPTGFTTPDGGPSACTDAAGNYTVQGMTAGSYKINFHDLAERYVDQWAFGAASYEDATVVVVPFSGAVVNATVQLGGEITGVITDEPSGQPLTTVEACAILHDVATGTRLDAFGRCIEGDGRYRIGAIPPGSYKLLLQAQDMVHLSEWADDAPDARRADVLTVASGTSLQVDAALARGGRISGVVTDALSGQPLFGMCATVGVYDSRAEGPIGEPANGGCTDASGHYTIGGLPTGRYHVQFYDAAGAYASEFLRDQPDRSRATRVRVTAGGETGGVDAALETAGILTGSITDAVTGAPVADACAVARSAKTGDPIGIFSCSDASGVYAVRGLPTTEVKVEIVAPTGYAGQWLFGATSLASATPIAVTAGTTRSGADVALQPAA
jgi:Carboxypeptidase regulatory-like domain